MRPRAPPPRLAHTRTDGTRAGPSGAAAAATNPAATVAPVISAARRDTPSVDIMCIVARPVATAEGAPQTASPRNALRETGATRKLVAVTNAIAPEGWAGGQWEGD